MEKFDEQLAYLHERTAPRPVVDVMRAAARVTVRCGLDYDAARWFLNHASDELADAITALETTDTIENTAVSEHTVKFDDPGTYAALAGLAWAVGMTDTSKKTFLETLQRSFGGHFARAADGSYLESREVADVPEHIRATAVLAARSRLDDDGTLALQDAFDPDGPLGVSPQAAAALESFVSYVEEHFGSVDNEDLDLKLEQKAVIRRITGAWYQTVNGTDARREPLTIAALTRQMPRSTAEMVVGRTIAALDRISAAGPVRPPTTVILRI